MPGLGRSGGGKQQLDQGEMHLPSVSVLLIHPGFSLVLALPSSPPPPRHGGGAGADWGM